MKSAKNRWTGRKGGNRRLGFSLIELLGVIAIIFIVSGMAILELQPTWQQSQANAGMVQIKSTLRQARETAIAQRRTIAVQFTGNNTISLFQFVVVGATSTLAATPYLTMAVQKNVKFMTFTGMPDTPDAFGLPGAGNGIEFGLVMNGPPTGMQFQSDGTFTDGTGTVINGTVFMGVAGMPSSARAVTVLGNTGRVRAYRGTGTGWFQ
jgi:Tfp pilus assembly protein FimT